MMNLIGSRLESLRRREAQSTLHRLGILSSLT